MPRGLNSELHCATFLDPLAPRSNDMAGASGPGRNAQNRTKLWFDTFY
jgi:hypothetical protein